jgi:hypothetical protein
MRRAWYWAWLVSAGALLTAAPSFARVPTRLVYSRTPAASDCPDEATLAAAVAARLGYEPFSPWGDQTILATVTRSGGIVVGRAELIDHDGIAQGSREVKNPECSELLLALALAISITLDPLHVEPVAEIKPVFPPEAAAPPQEPQAPTEPRPQLAEAPVARAERPSTRVVETLREPVTWHVAAAAIGALEAAPQLALGGRLAVAARLGRWSLGVEAWSTLPTTQANVLGGEVRVRLLSAALTPCFRLVGGLSFCALGSLGSMRAEGRGVETPRTENVLYATAGGRALFALPVGERFELLANADLAATLNRPRFQLDQAEVWRPGPVVALLGIGASARFF